MAHDDDHRKPRMEDWGVLNAVPEPPPEEIDLAPRSRPRAPEQPPPNSLLPDPDMLVDVPIKSHRSYAGLVFLVVIALGGVGLYFVMSRDLESDRVRGNPEGIQLGTPQSITAAGAAPEEIEIAPPPKKTLLRLESDPPGARVVVNGNPHGSPTPTAVQTFVGQPVRVHMYLDGHAPIMKALTITGSEETLKLALEEAKVETGSLEVNSDPPGAFITYGGVVVGETPFKLEGLPAGHPIFFRLQKEGHEPHTVRYEVGAGAERRIGVRMVPVDPDNARAMATVTVESDPLVARIDRVAGGKNDREGSTGSRPVQVFARIGYPLVLEASARDYGKDRVAIDVVDPNYTVLMRLPPPKKVYGGLKITGPKSLTVYVDAEEQDTLPIELKNLLAGEHDLVVVEPETKTKAKFKVRVGEDATVTKALRLTDDGRIVLE